MQRMRVKERRRQVRLVKQQQVGRTDTMQWMRAKERKVEALIQLASSELHQSKRQTSLMCKCSGKLAASVKASSAQPSVALHTRSCLVLPLAHLRSISTGCTHGTLP